MTEPIFYQNAYHNWSYSTIENNWDVYDLPLGAKFQSIHEPMLGSTTYWIRTRFRVDMYFDPASKKQIRGYIAEHSKRYDDCPVPREQIVFSEKIAIVGSRDYPHLEHVALYVNRLPMNAVVISGGARGVDTAAEQAAKARRMKTVIYPADWDTHGKQAGFLRNQDIVKAADRLIAFIHNGSRGTSHSIRLAQEAGKPVMVIDSTGEVRDAA